MQSPWFAYLHLRWFLHNWNPNSRLKNLIIGIFIDFFTIEILIVVKNQIIDIFVDFFTIKILILVKNKILKILYSIASSSHQFIVFWFLQFLSWVIIVKNNSHHKSWSSSPLIGSFLRSVQDWALGRLRCWSLWQLLIDLLNQIFLHSFQSICSRN